MKTESLLDRIPNEKSIWHVKRVSPEDYEHLVPDRRVFFNEPRFTELNREKVDDVYYLILMRGESARFGIIAGRIHDEFRTPFSAPYSYPVSIIEESKQETIDAALYTFISYAEAEGIRLIRFILPPLFYDSHLLNGWISSFYRQGFDFSGIDLNYSLDLDKLNVNEEIYWQFMTQRGRKALRRAQRSGMVIQKCETEADYREAYDIIKIGHDAKGFPVKLSFEQLMDTLKLVEHDAFIVRLNGTGIVAEYLYRINNRIVQGIYTGTHPDYMDCNGMNLLTYYTIRYYGDKGYKILDKATASLDSEPNYGLCNFKESVGCERSLKFLFTKRIDQ